MEQFYPDIWNEHELKPEQIMQLDFKDSRFYIKRTSTHWFVSNESTPVRKGQYLLKNATRIPKDVTLEQYAVKSDNILIFEPLLSDKSVVLRPDTPVVVLPNQRIQYYITLPLWIRIAVKNGNDKITLSEKALSISSDTWFGDALNGELCYSVDHSFCSAIEEVSNSPSLAICPILIRNNSPSPLRFERICVRCLHLRIYKGQNSLWTNELRVNFKGQEQISHVEYRDGPPQFEQNMKLIQRARLAPDNSIFKRSFSFFKYFSN